MRALARAAVGVVLLPKVAGRLPLGDHVAHEVVSKLGVHLGGALLRRPLGGCVVVEAGEAEVVEVDPDGAAPVGRIAGGVLAAVPR
eukprot:3698060-Prymnesium_polylepis.1